MRFRAVFLFWAQLCLELLPSSAAANTTAADCACGYYDPKNQNLFTESIVVYFNETTALPIPGFVEESFTHPYEKGWNTQFREGADVSNVNISTSLFPANISSSLELRVDPSQPNHLCVGSSVRTERQDIQYGSFTSLMRSPAQWLGGSALSMALQYNLSQMITMNLQNTNIPSTASVSMLENEEFPDTNLGVPYGNMTNGTFGNGTISPWDYTEFRMDWTKKEVKFYIGGYLARTISKNQADGLFSTPSPLYLRHLSNGNFYASQGPPTQPSVANIGWVRTFFNSSLMTEDDHVSFDKRCRILDACSSDDMTLRGSTPYPQEATIEWEQQPNGRPKRWFAIWLAIACIALTSFLLLNPLWKRVRERVNIPSRTKPQPDVPTISEPLPTMSRLYDSREATLAGSAYVTPNNRTRPPSITTTLNETRPSSTSATPYNRTRPSSTSSKYDSNGKSHRMSSFHEEVVPCSSRKSLRDSSADSETNTREWTSPENPSTVTWPKKGPSSDEISISSATGYARGQEGSMSIDEIAIKSTAENAGNDEIRVIPIYSKPAIISGKTVVVTEAEITNEMTITTAKKGAADAPKSPEASKSLPEAKKRVDYLAGLVAVSSLLVTAIHFSLTFVYGDLNAGAFTHYHSKDLNAGAFIHYHSEEIARKTINSFLLNLIWIGPFLMTSTRFLVSSYLRSGDLLPVAEKTVGRTFRLMIPITAMVMLEYFFINCGATKWLEYLPSITWSTWPFTVGYTNFGNFVSEVLELMYLIPNAAPIITFNYCTGVLWTIPVQLQGSWLTLLAVIVICEIKTPWKRFGFYAFCILNHWYALSWGSYFYVGILLTDLDITYKWRPYLHARPLAYYPLLLFCVLLGFSGLTMDFITQWTEVNYATYEYAIHPDTNSGLSIAQAGHAAYPQYFYPRLNGIAFAVGLQAAVELSPLIQKIFSFKLLVLVFPHIFTIYLLHGFVFWSLGSWLCLTLAVHGLPYWLNLLLVALCCYTTIALSLPLVTPVVETLGKSITGDIWQFAHEEPVPRVPTLHPYPADFLLNRYETPHESRPTKDVKIGNLHDPEK